MDSKAQEHEVTTEQVWVDLCAFDEVPAAEEGGQYVIHRARPLAVFRDSDGAPRVIDDSCPHAGGSLSAGHIAGDCVICPWHGWNFNIRSGICPDSSHLRVRIFPARLVDGRVQANLGCEHDVRSTVQE